MDNSNINELDSYGVWVKPSSNSNSQIPDEQDTDTSDLSFDNLSNLVEDESNSDDLFPHDTEEIEPENNLLPHENEETEPTNNFLSQETEEIESTDVSDFGLEEETEEDASPFDSEKTETETANTESEESQLGDFDIPETSTNSAVSSDDSEVNPFETPSDDIFAIDDSMTGDPIVEEETEFEEQVNPYEDAFKDFTDITDEENVALSSTNISSSTAIVSEEIHDEPPAQETESIETSDSENNSHITENNSNEAELLHQIVAELAGLKTEIASLKENFNELRQRSEELAVGQKAEEPPVDTGGFFTDDDDDDTISLSGDELSNIMNSVDFSQTEIVDIQDTDQQTENDPFADESTGIDETETTSEASDSETEDIYDKHLSEMEIDDAPVITEDIFEISEDSENSEEDTFEIDENIKEDVESFETQDNSVISDENFEIPEDEIIDDTASFAENSDATEYISDSDDVPSITEDNSEFDDIDFSNDLSVSEDTGFISDDLPDEISVPRIDDIVVGSSDEDFMDSVKDVEDAQERFGLMAEIPEELPYDTLEGDTLGESIEEIEEELHSLEQGNEFESLQNVDEIMTADPEIKDSITESNIDYLHTDENAELDNIIDDDDEQIIEETENGTEESNSDASSSPVTDSDASDTDSEIPSSLKNEIKSVLLYMDQLLENLPEEKIVEFAQSEQFNTYKKLFSELGLS